MQKKVELLAPAGNYQCFSAAIMAGADAVYLGGNQYGARAYADNFTEEEIVRAIKLAHLFGRKIYMTVNTLAKEDELSGLVSYMTPYYEAGLDGVIIQDFGVFLTLKEHFPGMELHASTQMTLTGIYGASFLKQQGACRIVPARELSLEEIKKIKDEVHIDIEAFIHGAMCYAYSGQCLYSSLLGGRSGNRGRCAGPCRLPFHCDGKEAYPLSLKDMYTLPYIGQLIEAGIDSFKIEGRMKSAEYVAGVTSVYRKYIDQYYEAVDKGTNRDIQVSRKDENIVKGLYIRSGLHEGYYFKHNGKEMVTLQGGSYAGTDESVLELIRKQYVEQKPEIKVFCKASFKVGQNAKMLVSSKEFSDEDYYETGSETEKRTICMVEGDEVQAAQKRPLSKEDILKQLQKTGDTNFKAIQIEIDMDDSIFMPVKALNELRRSAYEAYESLLLADSYRKVDEQNLSSAMNGNNEEDYQNEKDYQNKNPRLSVLITTKEQFIAACNRYDLDRVYVDIDILNDQEMTDKLLEHKKDMQLQNYSCEWIASLPYILRKRSYGQLQSYETILKTNGENNVSLIDGILVRNLEELQWLKEISYDGKKISDANIYLFNQKTKEFFKEFAQEQTVPVELNRRERKNLGIHDMESVVYGRTPMMYTANCTRKTLAVCDGITGFDYITDRYKNKVPVYHNCKHCYNVIYNSVPLSLHQYLPEIQKDGGRAFRLEFTNESADVMNEIIDAYLRLIPRKDSIQANQKNHKAKEFVLAPGTYTTGHYKRGVE